MYFLIGYSHKIYKNQQRAIIMKDFSIHILSSDAGNIYINGKFVGLLDNLDNFSIDLKVYSKTLVITKEPISNEKKLLLPYTVKISFESNIKSDSELLEIVPYKNNEYEILLKACDVKHYKPLTKIFDEEIDGFNVVVVNDGNSYINIYKNGILKWSDATMEINNITCEHKNNKIIIKGITLNANYYLIVLNENFEVLFNGEAEKIEQDDYQIKLLKKINDIAKHAIVKTINYTDEQPVEDYYVYLKPDAVITDNTKLIPYAFLEAVKVKNYSLAKQYLSAELNLKTKNEHLENYFQNLKNIYYNSYNNNNYVINYTILCDNNYKSYDFTVFNNKIEDIEEVYLNY